jgi:hypothetical protein
LNKRVIAATFSSLAERSGAHRAGQFLRVYRFSPRNIRKVQMCEASSE